MSRIEIEWGTDMAYGDIFNLRSRHCAIVAILGPGTPMWKFDLVSARMLVTSLVQDWHLPGELEIIEGEVF